jgi:dTDP-4-dehydrorhamnose reductase
MRIAFTGGWGRLGCRMVPLLRQRGHIVFRPTKSDLDATSQQDVERYLDLAQPDIMIALAAFTDVAAAEHSRQRAIQGNIDTARATAAACESRDVAMLYCSSDYVIPILRGERAPFYAATKLLGERAAMKHGAKILRVAFTTPEQTQNWRWVNAHTLSNRAWVEDIAIGFVDYIESGMPHEVAALNPPESTMLDLLRSRYPDHPALRKIIETAEQMIAQAGFAAPRDTRWEADHQAIVDIFPLF